MINIKKSILFGITSLEMGGAERVLVDVANKLSERYDVNIFSIYDNGAIKKDLNEHIKFKSMYKCRYDELNTIQKAWSPIRILFFRKLVYQKYIKSNYDVEIAFLEGPITRLFSSKNSGSKKIAWIHNDIQQVFGKGLKAKLKHWIDKVIYNRYDSLVFVSNDNMKTFKKIYRSINQNKMYAIANYINKDLILKKANDDEKIEYFNNDERPIFLTVCRLVKQKAIDRLIKVHSKLVKDGYKHTIYVVGDGPEKEDLLKLIENEDVKNSFKLIGKKENPYPYMQEADYFCLLSYFEGYGMVLEEAKVLNKKIIITDTAAREAVENYKKAVIVDNNEQEIYNGLKELIVGTKTITDSDEDKYDNSKSINDIISLIER